MVKVPLVVAFTTLQPPSQSWYAFWTPFMWKQSPPPMGSKGLPYSMWRQSASAMVGQAIGTAFPANEQRMADECTIPKLWPGSCTSTVQLWNELYQLLRVGRSA